MVGAGMAMCFVEGFEEYTTTAGITLGNDMVAMRPQSGYGWNYAYVNSTLQLSSTFYRSPQTGNPRSLCLKSAHMNLKIPVANELIVGFAVYMAEGGTSTFLVLSNSHSTSTSLPTNGLRLRTTIAGEIEVVKSDTSTVLGKTPAATLLAACWTYVELRYVFGASGTVQLRVENSEVLSLAGLDTRGGAASIQNIGLWCSSPSYNTYFDDFYVCDNSGTTNNTFLGPVVVQSLVPNEDVQSGFSRNTGLSNFSCVNETPHDADTSFLFARDLNTHELLGFTDVTSLAGGGIAALQVHARTRSQGGPVKFALVLNSSGGTKLGSLKLPTPTAWVTDFEIFEKQTDGSDWTEAAVNACKSGFEIGES